MAFNLIRDTKEYIDERVPVKIENYNLINRISRLENWMNQREPDIKNMIQKIQAQQDNLMNQQSNLESSIRDIAKNQDNIQISLTNAQTALNKSMESYNNAYQAALDAKQALNAAEMVNGLATDAKNKALEAAESASVAYSNAEKALNNAQTAWDTAKTTWDTSMNFFERSFKDIRDKSVKLAEGFNGLGNGFVNEANAIYAKSQEVVSAGTLKEWNIVGIKFKTMKTPFDFVSKLVSSIVQNFTSFGNIRNKVQIVEGNSMELYEAFEKLYKDITGLMGSTYLPTIPIIRTADELTPEQINQIETDEWLESGEGDGDIMPRAPPPDDLYSEEDEPVRTSVCPSCKSTNIGPNPAASSFAVIGPSGGGDITPPPAFKCNNCGRLFNTPTIIYI